MLTAVKSWRSLLGARRIKRGVERRCARPAAGVLVAVALPGVLLGCGSGAKTDQTRAPRALGEAPVTYAAYPALRDGKPGRIAVVSLSRAPALTTSRARPIWVSARPQNQHAVLPEIATAREVRREGAMRAWISKNDEGGVCLLVYDPAESSRPATDHTIIATCGDRSELASCLDLVQRAGPGAPESIVGLVPAGVTAVQMTLGNGRVIAASVAANSFSVTTMGRVTRMHLIGRGNGQYLTIQ